MLDQGSKSTFDDLHTPRCAEKENLKHRKENDYSKVIKTYVHIPELELC